jgi:hypothetical protein
MRFVRFGLLAVFLIIGVSVLAQQPASSQQASAPPPAPKDPQAVSVLNQALAVAGGATTINAIADYVAKGNVTYHWAEDVRGTVALLGMGGGDIRIDAYLPTGARSEAIHDGQSTIRAADGTISQNPPSYKVPSSDAFPYEAPFLPASLGLPYLQLTAVLASPRMSLSYKGLVQLDGHSVHQVEAQRNVGKGGSRTVSEYETWEFFIDPSTLELVMVRDVFPLHVIHEIRYSDYQPVSGVLVPFSIREQMGGQPTWEMQIGQISFNTGLQDSSFIIQ